MQRLPVFVGNLRRSWPNFRPGRGAVAVRTRSLATAVGNNHKKDDPENQILRVTEVPSAFGQPPGQAPLPTSGTTVYTCDASSVQWKRVERVQTVEPAAWQQRLLHPFLPARYPHSVASGYGRFSVLAFGASVAGSTAMVLSTQTLLLAVGVVGSNGAHASVMAGALNWVLKDGVGQLGGVLFASWMSQRRTFDDNPKQWRMVAALSLDAASCLELLSPFAVSTSLVLPLACVANGLKNIGFLTASASRAALHQSLATTGNLADVTAKAGSQSIAAGLMGTALGVGLSKLLGQDVHNYMAAFVALSLVHQGCNYASLHAVSLTHFNRHRLHLVLDEFVMKRNKDGSRQVLTPSAVAAREVYAPWIRYEDDAHQWLSIGSPITTVCPGGYSDLANLLQACPDNTAYLLSQTNDGRLHLVFCCDATGQDQIRGMLHAYLLRQRILTRNVDKSVAVVSKPHDSILHNIRETHLETQALAPNFLARLQESGWMLDTNVTNVEPTGARRLVINSQEPTESNVHK